MNVHIEAAVASPLDRLEVKGRRFVMRRARRAAIRTGVRLAAATALLASVVLLLGALSGYRATGWSVLAVPALAIAVGTITVAILQRRVRVARADALATLDRRLATNDRIGTVDEFAGLPRRDGYRQAAIDEAMPWLDDALAARVELPASAQSPIRRDVVLMAGGAAVLVLAAMLVGNAGERDVGVLHPHDARSADAVDSLPPPAVAAVERIRDLAARVFGVEAGRSPSAGGRSDDSVSAAGSPGGRAGAATGAAGKEAGVSPRQGSATAADTASRAGDRPGAPGGRAAPKGGTGSPQSGEPGGVIDRDAGGDRTDAGDRTADPAGRAPPSLPPRAAPRPGGSQQSPAAAAAMPTRAGPPTAKSASRTPSGNANQAKRGQGGRPGQSRNGGQRSTGSGGGTTGADALKRSRGAATLMLAVPMDDRVSGAAGPGRSTSMLRPARPRGAPAPVVTAGDRGTQNGTAGDVVHRETGVHDDRIVRDYFLRRNGQAR